MKFTEVEQNVFEFSFIIEGATEKVFKFYTEVISIAVTSFFETFIILIYFD